MLKWLSGLSSKSKSRGKNTSLDKSGGASRGRKRGKRRAQTGGEFVRIPRSEHGISRKGIDENALKVLYRLHKAGFHACLVGGAVRDLMLGVRPKDFDIATDATPEQVDELFRNCRLIGRRFRLAHVHFGRMIIEVATFRASHDHTGAGHQDASGRILRDNVYGAIEEDVWRRDFTANALYYDIDDFSVIDYVNGMQDIRDRRLRMIGDTETRFREDPVRMIRAIRFAAKLGFDIDEEIEQAIREHGRLLIDVPSARLYEETLKLFHSGHAVESFAALQEYDLLRYLFPMTADAIYEDASVTRFIELALTSTDARITAGQPVTPAFLFAAMLWAPLKLAAEREAGQGVPYGMALQQSISGLINNQVRSLSIPRRFTTVMRDIWAMQSRFRYRKGRRAESLLEHPKFRAGYDFLCLRARSGEDVQEDCDFWTERQKQSPAHQNREQQREARPRNAKKKRSRRRRKPAASKSE